MIMIICQPDLLSYLTCIHTHTHTVWFGLSDQRSKSLYCKLNVIEVCFVCILSICTVWCLSLTFNSRKIFRKNVTCGVKDDSNPPKGKGHHAGWSSYSTWVGRTDWVSSIFSLAQILKGFVQSLSLFHFCVEFYFKIQTKQRNPASGASLSLGIHTDERGLALFLCLSLFSLFSTLPHSDCGSVIMELFRCSGRGGGKAAVNAH